MCAVPQVWPVRAPPRVPRRADRRCCVQLDHSERLGMPVLPSESTYRVKREFEKQLKATHGKHRERAPDQGARAPSVRESGHADEAPAPRSANGASV